MNVDRWAATGSQILEAIGNLSQLVERQHSNCHCCSAQQYQEAPSQRSALAEPFVSNLDDYRNRDVKSNSEKEVLIALGDSANETQSLRLTQGLENVLRWRGMERFQTSRCLFADTEPPIVYTSTLPSTDYNQMSQLASNYVRGVHYYNPFLDLTELDYSIRHIAENGLDWTTRSCLVTLVCAIGAFTELYEDRHLSPANTSTPGAPQRTLSIDDGHDVSLQFWTLASRRLGAAIGQNDLEAVQCLCLAGIWYMHQMEPLQAWKYFNLAGAASHGVRLTKEHALSPGSTNHSSNSFTTKQALYFTIWKSQGEIENEIGVPPSILEDFGKPFPLPPVLPDEPGLAAHERAWYYYLADIAARHLTNRVTRLSSFRLENPTEQEVHRMVAHAEVIKAQLYDWHQSLPPEFRFELPRGYSVRPPEDDVIQILRFRYLVLIDLIGRPFVKLCVETPLNLEHHLRARVLSLASECIRCSLLKLSTVAPHLHQGTWYMLRVMAMSAAILTAVHLAKTNVWTPGAQDLELPEGWRQCVIDAFEIVGPYWNSRRGGANNMRDVVQNMLDATAPS